MLVQSVPMYSVTKVVKLVKSLMAREALKNCPQVKKQLWGGNSGVMITLPVQWASMETSR